MFETWQPSASQEARLARAAMLENIRQFFQNLNVLEVQTPVLSVAGTTDPFIDSFKITDDVVVDTVVDTHDPGYLITSPEFHMKRLLASGSGDIYQITPVFRVAESGNNHNPEFTMLEWYRLGMDHMQLAEEVIQLLVFLIGKVTTAKQHRPFQVVYKKYAELFQQQLGLDVHSATAEKLEQVAREHDIQLQKPLGKDEWLDLLLSCLILNTLPDEQLTIIYDYPASQASLARLNKDYPTTAARFEVLWGSLEVANGFNELQDSNEQRERFAEDNRRRIMSAKEEVPADEYLLQALNSGLPDCSGVAVGIDRVLMRLLGESSIDAVINFPTDRA